MLDQPFRQVAALWVAIGLLAPSPAATAAAHYSVTTGEDLEYLDVRACFEVSMPRRLVARHELAADLLRDLRLESGDDSIRLQPRGSSVTLPRARTPSCVRYRVDLSAVGGRGLRSGGTWRTEHLIVLDPALWLWYPELPAQEGGWRLDFRLPPGYDVSAPWQRIGQREYTVSYQLRERMAGWNARMAIGRFSVESIELPGGRLRYALLPGEPAPDAALVQRWISAGARALLSAYGRLPVPDVQLLVVPIGHGGDPVPWGEVQRGGGDAVHLFIDQRRPAEEFRADWVLVHELSHLLHPIIFAPDRWLSEGIASYYQNVLRARVGLLTAQAAWERLHAGFERGRHGTPRGRSLAEVSETMLRDRSFMRVYWSGAAIALLADVELRRRSGGAQSLDTALAAFRDCCLPADRSWSARELMYQLDRLTGTTVFMELYRAHVDSDEFPGLDAVYAELGLQPMSAERLHIDPTASGAALGTAIMRAPEG